jgi:hypothetical protein
MLSDASVIAEAKAKRILSRPLAVHVELIGILEDFFISVGGLIGCDNAFICTDELAWGQSAWIF